MNMGQRASDTRGVTFEDVVVPKENVLGKEGIGFKIAMGAFDKTRPPVAASAVGLARRALEEATKYSMERKTMGKPIFQHQAVSFMLADMAIGVETARLATYRAAWEVDQSQTRKWILICLHCVLLSEDKTLSLLQNPSKRYESVLLFKIYEGTAQIQRVIIGRELIEKAKMTM
ncbi:unnamed protein product [Porites evermanni]|uniref:Acyl-CoA dehydrogenase/oxidase C-terminal domain-containing protein n=1 Tax=Porites evermanni TaxID=104178 RepID=A0ABN8T1A9_9CNID|nr:unnamed protein product [Porites evermanni]